MLAAATGCCAALSKLHSLALHPRLQAEGAEVEELRAATAQLQEKVQGLLQATQQKDQQLQQVGRSSSQQEQLLEAFSGRCTVAESEVGPLKEVCPLASSNGPCSCSLLGAALF